MGTKVKALVGSLAGCVLLAGTAAAQTQTMSGRSALDAALYRSVCERVQTPMVFSTRDTAFALSLPTDEPATISLQVTVAKNGKVKEKLTRVNANHIAGYVAPAFVAATKGLRVDRSLLNGNDTSLMLSFPLEYQCVYDTINKEWPSAGDRLTEMSSIINTEAYPKMFRHNGHRPMTNSEIEEAMRLQTIISVSGVESDYRKASPTRLWYYLAFIKDQYE